MNLDDIWSVVIFSACMLTGIFLTLTSSMPLHVWITPFLAGFAFTVGLMGFLMMGTAKVIT